MGDRASLAEELSSRGRLMLKLITLAACVIGFVFLGPKALADFRQARPRTKTRLGDKAKSKDSEIAA